MTNDLKKQRTDHDAHVTYVEQQIEHSKAIDRLEKTLTELMDRLVAWYEAFVEFEDGTTEYWLAKPEHYAEDEDKKIRELRTRWNGILYLAVKVLDGANSEWGIDPACSKRVRKFWSDAASVDLMDHGSLPPHMVKFAQEAEKALKAGEVEGL